MMTTTTHPRTAPSARRVLLIAAVVTSLIGVAMAAAAALERGSTLTDRALIIAVAIAITLGAHVLPAITRRAAGYALWVACLTLTVYGHAVFFTAAADRAGATRAEAVEEDGHTQALRTQLDSIHARPAADIARDIATAQAAQAAAGLEMARCEHKQPGRCGAPRLSTQQQAAHVVALKVEQTEATRAAGLLDQLTAAAVGHDTARTRAATDPVAARLAELTGLPASALITAVSILSAAVVELMAALLWTEALAPQTSAHQPTAQDGPSVAITTPINPSLPSHAVKRPLPTSTHVTGTPTIHREGDNLPPKPCAKSLHTPKPGSRLRNLLPLLSGRPSHSPPWISWLLSLTRAHRSSA